MLQAGIFSRLCISVAATLVLGASQPALSDHLLSPQRTNTLAAITTYYQLVVDGDGVLWTWGENTNGRLGDGTTEDRAEPVKILDDVAWVWANDYFSAAIRSDGSLWTWGDNSYGQLGDGTKQNSLVPIKVMDGVVSMYGAPEYCAALQEDGSLWTWGCNEDGQLGDGTTQDRATPQKVMDHVVDFGLGYDFMAAVKDDGSLYVWGALPIEWGDPAIVIMPAVECTPLKIMENVVSMEICSNHVAVICADNSLWIWRENLAELLRYGTKDNLRTPVKILDRVAVIYSNAAICTDGSLWTWSSSRWEQQDNQTTHESFRPRPEKVMEDVAALYTGYGGTIVVRTNGDLWAWGTFGYLGLDGSIGPAQTPHKVMEDAVYFASEGTSRPAVVCGDGSLWTFHYEPYSHYYPVKLLDGMWVPDTDS